MMKRVEKNAERSAREQKCAAPRARTQFSFAASLPNGCRMDSPLHVLRLTSASVSNAPLSTSRPFVFCFQVYWGDHTRFTRAPRVAPRGFWDSPQSLITDGQHINTRLWLSHHSPISVPERQKGPQKCWLKTRAHSPLIWG